MRPSERILSLALGILAGCASGAPPDVTAPVSSQPPTKPTAAPVRATPTPGPSERDPAGDLGRVLDIGRLDPRWTTPLLEFASDGDAIVFSSGVEVGPRVEIAPDLWRYLPGAPAPELLWRNPERDHTLVKIGGEFGVWAFVDVPTDGERSWTLWVLAEGMSEPIELDSHPGDADVSSLVPSFSVHLGRVVWTAFDRSPGGPVSQLLVAEAPGWEPVVLAERDARLAELWLPSLRDTELAFCEVVYSADRSTDERHVYVMSLSEPAEPARRIDESARATMPILLMNGGIVWKEAEPGFNMFNWGRMVRYDEDSGEAVPLPTRPQDFVNHPSAGHRFVAWWGVADRAFGVYDLDLEATRLIDRWPVESNVHVLRPHISGSLLVWLHAEFDGLGVGPDPEIRYAFLPAPGSDRGP